MEKSTFVFNLSELVEYSRSGDFHKTATIEFTGPTMEVFDTASELSQLVVRAVLDAKDLSDNFGGEKTNQAQQEMDAEAMKIILLSSKNVRFSDVAKVCRRLFLKVGTFDGEVKLKESILNKISVDDFTRMVCEYVVNFTFPSLFSQTMGEK